MNKGLLATPSASASPAPSKFFQQPFRVEGSGPPQKRQKTAPSDGGSSNNSTADLDQQRRDSALWMLDIWAGLAQKYSTPIDEDDIVDIRTGQIVKDRGVLRARTKKLDIGDFLDQAGGAAEEIDDTEEDDGADIDELDTLTNKDLIPAKDDWNVPPITMDPAYAEDLKAFLIEEARRKEQFGNDDRDTDSLRESTVEEDQEQEELDNDDENQSESSRQDNVDDQESESEDELGTWGIVDEGNTIYLVDKESLSDQEESDVEDVFDIPVSTSSPRTDPRQLLTPPQSQSSEAPTASSEPSSPPPALKEILPKISARAKKATSKSQIASTSSQRTYRCSSPVAEAPPSSPISSSPAKPKVSQHVANKAPKNVAPALNAMLPPLIPRKPKRKENHAEVVIIRRSNSTSSLIPKPAAVLQTPDPEEVEVPPKAPKRKPGSTDPVKKSTKIDDHESEVASVSASRGRRIKKKQSLPAMKLSSAMVPTTPESFRERPLPEDRGRRSSTGSLSMSPSPLAKKDKEEAASRIPTSLHLDFGVASTSTTRPKSKQQKSMKPASDTAEPTTSVMYKRKRVVSSSESADELLVEAPAEMSSSARNSSSSSKTKVRDKGKGKSREVPKEESASDAEAPLYEGPHRHQSRSQSRSQSHAPGTRYGSMAPNYPYYPPNPAEGAMLISQLFHQLSAFNNQWAMPPPPPPPSSSPKSQRDYGQQMFPPPMPIYPPNWMTYTPTHQRSSSRSLNSSSSSQRSSSQQPHFNPFGYNPYMHYSSGSLPPSSPPVSSPSPPRTRQNNSGTHRRVSFQKMKKNDRSDEEKEGSSE